MDNQPQEQPQHNKLSKTHGTSLVPGLTVDQLFVASCITDLNMIRTSPLTSDEIEMWTRTIYRVRPEITPDIVGKVVDKFITAEWYFEKEEGIRNIFKGIDQLMSGVPDNYIAP